METENIKAAEPSYADLVLKVQSLEFKLIESNNRAVICKEKFQVIHNLFETLIDKLADK